MDNFSIAALFDLLAKLMEIHGENSFKIKSYKGAAFKIEKLNQPIISLSPSQIRSIPGIGDAITQKIIEIKETGNLSALEQYMHATPRGVIELMNIKGLGPKKIRQLWQELQIESIGELEYACNENRLIGLNGFGAKTQSAIINSIKFLQSNTGFFLYADLDEMAKNLLENIKSIFADNKISFTGAFRRKMPVLKMLEFVTDIPQEDLYDFLTQLDNSTIEMTNNNTKIIVKNLYTFYFIHCKQSSFAETLFLTTNPDKFSEIFNIKYHIPDGEITNEQDIFTNNGLAYIPASLRDLDHALSLAEENKIPSLIREEDIKGLIHCHSDWSDGKNTIEEMALAAQKRGWEYMVITDHSQAAFYAKGLHPDKVLAQHQYIDKLNHTLAPFKIFKGIEADILSDGSLDYNSDIIQSFDLVIASIHSNLKMSEEKAMNRLKKAIENPYTRILGHPTGRLLLSREAYPVDHEKLIDMCVANQVVIEINAHPRRLDLDWQWVYYALNRGAMLSINPDAHSTNGIDMIKYGVYAAQKGGLTAQQNLSSKNIAGIEQFIANR